MANEFEVHILSAKQVHTLPGAWSPDTLRTLLTLLEFDDANQIEDRDLPEMAIMAMQDLGNQLAGERVLEVIFGDAMRAGVRQNLVDDLQQDEPWEDFANVSQQRGLFEAVVLLQKAFPNRYAEPDALALQFTVKGAADADALAANVGDAAWLVRLLAHGMDETTPLHRLYEAEIASGPFTEAAGLIWHLDIHDPATDQATGRSMVTVDLVAPNMWFESLEKGQVFAAEVASSGSV